MKSGTMFGMARLSAMVVFWCFETRRGVEARLRIPHGGVDVGGSSGCGRSG